MKKCLRLIAIVLVLASLLTYPAMAAGPTLNYVAITSELSAAYPDLLEDYLNDTYTVTMVTAKKDDYANVINSNTNFVTIDIGSDYFGTNMVDALVQGETAFLCILSDMVSAYKGMLEDILRTVYSANPDAYVLIIGVNNIFAGKTITPSGVQTAWENALQDVNDYARNDNSYVSRTLYTYPGADLGTVGDDFLSSTVPAIEEIIRNHRIDRADCAKNDDDDTMDGGDVPNIDETCFTNVAAELGNLNPILYDYASSEIDTNPMIVEYRTNFSQIYSDLIEKVKNKLGLWWSIAEGMINSLLSEDMLRDIIDNAILVAKQRAVGEELVPEINDMLTYAIIDLNAIESAGWGTGVIEPFFSTYLETEFANLFEDEAMFRVGEMMNNPSYKSLVEMVSGMYDVKQEVAEIILGLRGDIPQEATLTNAQMSLLHIYMSYFFNTGMFAEADMEHAAGRFIQPNAEAATQVYNAILATSAVTNLTVKSGEPETADDCIVEITASGYNLHAGMKVFVDGMVDSDAVVTEGGARFTVTLPENETTEPAAHTISFGGKSVEVTLPGIVLQDGEYLVADAEAGDWVYAAKYTTNKQMEQILFGSAPEDGKITLPGTLKTGEGWIIYIADKDTYAPKCGQFLFDSLAS